tara:strand:+ start:6229 stop:6999 length:771 start_codon:yes stop_codon:yes gene_type:complete
MSKNQHPVAIVTGGSRGVGASTARMLCAKGWNVLITCTSTLDQAKEIASFSSNHETEITPIVSDVSNKDDCVNSVKKCIESWGRLDAIINNAGTTKFVWDHSDLDGLTYEDFVRIYAVNVIGPFQMVTAAKPFLNESPNPSIVNISSIAGIKGIGSSVAYAASKGALNTMTLSMARNLGPIRVNAICPGFIEGEWLKKGMGEEVYEGTKHHIENTAPLKKTCTPESIAEVVLHLVDGSNLVTGQLITVDGGVSLNL